MGARILRILRSQLFPCECLVGIYETYDGHTIGLIDATGPTCGEVGHRVGAEVDADLPRGWTREANWRSTGEASR